MNDLLKDVDLYVCTDRKLSLKSDIEVVYDAIAGGAKLIQYREKELSTLEMFNTAHKIREITYKNRVVFIVNDRVDIALAVDADGVHIGQDDLPILQARRLVGPVRLIGVTVHNVQEALDAEENGADYLGVSPIFGTRTKSDAGRPAGIQLIKDIKSACKIPIVAIGGINLDNIASVLGAGAESVCAISAVVSAPDVAGQVRKFLAFWK